MRHFWGCMGNRGHWCLLSVSEWFRWGQGDTSCRIPKFFISVPEPGLHKGLVFSLSLYPGILLTLVTLPLPSMISWQLRHIHVLQRYKKDADRSGQRRRKNLLSYAPHPQRSMETWVWPPPAIWNIWSRCWSQPGCQQQDSLSCPQCLAPWLGISYFPLLSHQVAREGLVRRAHQETGIFRQWCQL